MTVPSPPTDAGPPTDSGPVRLFVAARLPADVAQHLDRRLVAVRTEQPRLRWTPPDRWHLTLTFVGDVEADVRDELTRRLARAAGRSSPVRLSLGRAGRFDGRVLWLHVDGDVAGLRRLAARTTAAARRSGIAVEDRRYRPHLTLARSSRPVDLRPAVAALADYAGPEWPVTQVELVRSTLGGPGVDAAYTTLTAHPLARGPGR